MGESRITVHTSAADRGCLGRCENTVKKILSFFITEIQGDICILTKTSFGRHILTNCQK